MIKYVQLKTDQRVWSVGPWPGVTPLSCQPAGVEGAAGGEGVSLLLSVISLALRAEQCEFCQLSQYLGHSVFITSFSSRSTLMTIN